MNLEPSKYDLRNISPFLPKGTKTGFISPKFGPGMPLQGPMNVSQGVDTPQPLQTANKGGSTSEVQPSTEKLALEIPSMELGGGVRTAPVRMELAPVAPKKPTSKQK
jgi:hypothetical protein